MSMELRQALEQVARRFRHVRLWSALAICWLCWAFVGWGLALVLPRFGAESIPNAGLLMLPCAGHTINSEEPAAFNAALVEFFAAVENGRWRARPVAPSPS